jgi:hypothetical protein
MRIILKWMVVIWIGLIWLKIGNNRGLIEQSIEPSGSMLENSLVRERLNVCLELLCFMELVIWFESRLGSQYADP